MTTSPRPSAAEVESRLREASRVSDLSPTTRLAAKIDLSPEGVRRRLVSVSELLDACTELSAAVER